jgi:hypothetical protein
MLAVGLMDDAKFTAILEILNFKVKDGYAVEFSTLNY